MQAATLPAGFTETDIGGYWNDLVGITFDDIGTLFQWDRDGRVWVLENDVRLATPLIDISEEVGNWGDHGLLGFALHPNFRQNGYIYLLYIVDHHYLENYGTPNYDPAANDYNRATIGRITRYTARASDNFHSVDPASRVVLLGETATNGFPVTFDTHGAGTLLFGTDGTLLASFGDGGQLSDSGSEPTSFYQQALAEGIIKPKENVGSFRAQMVDSLSGKIIRIDPITGDGIPGNPFYDPSSPRAARSRVWALGLRNPFRIGLRPGTGSHNRADANPGVIYVGDVGYITWEKLSVIAGPGMNLGWPFYEGFDPPTENLDYDTVNQDAPNPLYGTAGCTQQYFRFADLLQEATPDAASWPNPCDPTQQIPSSIPHFVHTRPAIDWNHSSSGPSRSGTFSGSTATAVNIGAAGSPVSGPQFGGNCAIGGLWYTADSFPLQYKNTYFLADFGAQWIRNMTFDASNNPVSVRNFAGNAGSIVALAAHPTNGALYYVDIYTGIHKISYIGAGNQAPQAVAACDKNYGPTPLTVQFTGSGSSDPEGQPLTYRWDFGDGSATSGAANPQHIFTGAAGVPTRYGVTLTVTDLSGATNATQLIVSVNNTPPSVKITTPPDDSIYSVSTQSVYTLAATVTDQEQGQAQLKPQWQTILHHNNHIHAGAIDTNWTTSTLLSPFGCDGDSYYYSITLTVTDSAGLSGTDTVLLYPGCSNNTPPTISHIPDQSLAENESTGPINFDVADFETASTGLRLTARSSNPVLIPSDNIVLGGSGTARTVTVIPATGQMGSSTISILVNDGSLISTDTFLVTVGAGTTANYLFKEDFEGAGFENADWIKHGTPDEDYTTLPLHGSQSLHCLGMQSIERPFSPGGKFYMYFLVRWQAWGDFNDLIYFDDIDYSPAALLTLDSFDGTLSISHGSSGATSQNSVTLDTTYHVWLEWTPGSGIDGTMKVFVSTDSKKPATPMVALTDGNGNLTERMYLGPVSPGQDVIYDNILFASSPIGSNPLQQSAAPRIVSLGWTNGNHPQIVGAGSAGTTYKVQASSDLLVWQEIGSAVADSTDGQFTFEDATLAAPNVRFYRIAFP